METRFDGNAYAQRAQVETVISMIKRRQGAHVRGLSYWSQCRDLRLKVLTHNVMILVTVRLFYRAGHNYLSLLPPASASDPAPISGKCSRFTPYRVSASFSALAQKKA
jgi:hypothetical protein